MVSCLVCYCGKWLGHFRVKRNSSSFPLKLTLDIYCWLHSKSKTWSYMLHVIRKPDCHLPAVTNCSATGVGQQGHSLHRSIAVASILHWCWPITGKKGLFGAAVLVIIYFVIFYVFSFEISWVLSSWLKCATWLCFRWQLFQFVLIWLL